MITETREIYKCEHCRKVYQIKSACERHEKRCNKNPETIRACYGCIHLKEDHVDVHFSYMNPFGVEEYEESRKVLFCSKLNVYKYPPKIEYSLKGAYLQEDMGDGEIENQQCQKNVHIKMMEQEIYFFNGKTTTNTKSF